MRTYQIIMVICRAVYSCKCNETQGPWLPKCQTTLGVRNTRFTIYVAILKVRYYTFISHHHRRRHNSRHHYHYVVITTSYLYFSVSCWNVAEELTLRNCSYSQEVSWPTWLCEPGLLRQKGSKRSPTSCQVTTWNKHQALSTWGQTLAVYPVVVLGVLLFLSVL